MPRTFSPDRTPSNNEDSREDVVKVRHFHRPRYVSKVTTDTVRRRLFHDQEEEDGNVDFMRLPVIRKKVETSPDDRRRDVKKLKTTLTGVNINNNDVSQEEDPLVLAKALSKEQLLQLLSRLTSESPHLTSSLLVALPVPDIGPRVAQLTYHMHNIYRSIPHNRLSRTLDTVNRCKIQWAVFRKAMTDDLTELLESRCWSTVLDYVMAAWETVTMGLSDHSIRTLCLRQLASVIMRVAKHYQISLDMRSKLAEMMRSASSIQDISVCRQFLLSNNSV